MNEAGRICGTRPVCGPAYAPGGPMKNTLIVDRRTAAEAIQWVLERWVREDADAIERARLKSAGVLDAVERKGIGR
jgi:hypothetical protein